MHASSASLRRAALTCVLCALPLVSCGAPEVKVARSESAPQRGPCDDFEKDVERFWSSSAKADVRAGIVGATGEFAQTIVERVVTKMDNMTRDWVMMQESVCKDTVVRKVTPPEVYTKVAACMRVTLISQRTLVEVMRSPSRDQVFKLDDAMLTIGRDSGECQKEAIYTSYAPRESDRVAIVAARDGHAKTAPFGAGALGASDLDVAQQALGETRAYEKVADRVRWADAAERGLTAARRSKDPKVIVDLLLSDARRLSWLEGKYEPASKLAQEALELSNQVGYQEGLGGSYHRLGTVLNLQARYPEALEQFLKALPIREQALGQDHPDTASTHNNIAAVYEHQGKYAESLEQFQKALAIQEKVLGKEHPAVASTYNNIATVYLVQDRYPEALEWFQKALVTQEKALGKNHPDTATTYNNLGLVYRDLGKYPEALEWSRKALAVREVVLRADHPQIAGTCVNIGLVLDEQHKYAEAVEWYQRALVTQEKVLGKEHPDTARTYDNLGAVYDHQAKYPESLEWYRKAIATREKLLGKEHPDTADSYNGLGAMYDHQGNKPEALEWYAKAIEIRDKVLGKDNPDTADSYKRVRHLCTDLHHEPACAFLKQHPRT